MTGGFQASSAQLSAASSKVSGIASSIGECVTAARSEGVGGLVYGVLFDPSMLPQLSRAKDELSDMIDQVATATSAVAGGLKNNAETYESVESFLQQHFTGLQSQTDTGPV